MNILVVCQYYYPEPFRVSDICEELVRRGHAVTALTGVPNYPEGAVYDGYRHGKKRRETVNGVDVVRCFTIGRRRGAFFRLLNYYSYAISSALSIHLGRCGPRSGREYDVILVNQLSPVMMAYAGLAYKKRRHKKLVLYCLDLWPESLIGGGVRRGSGIFRFFHGISGRIYRNCDQILVTSRSFMDYFSREFAIERDRLAYLPQYAETLFSGLGAPAEGKEGYDLVFAGNIGEFSGVPTIIDAAGLLEGNEELRFHVVGGGTCLERCKRIAAERQLKNIVFHGRKPIEEMGRYYSMADAMLVTLSADPVISLTLPGKVQSYMAAGKPVLGAIDGEAQRTVCEARCGYVGAADDAEGLAENIERFIRLSSEEKRQLGRRAREYYERNFSKEVFMSRMEHWLRRCSAGPGDEGEAIGDGGDAGCATDGRI